MKTFFPQSQSQDGISQTSGGISVREYAAIEIYAAILAGRKITLTLDEYLDRDTRMQAIEAADTLLEELAVTERKQEKCLNNR